MFGVTFILPNLSWNDLSIAKSASRKLRNPRPDAILRPQTSQTIQGSDSPLFRIWLAPVQKDLPSNI